MAAVVTLLRERREAIGMSKRLLAEKAGVTRTAIILMERHERSPSLELVRRLAKHLGLSFGDVAKQAEKSLPRD